MGLNFAMRLLALTLLAATGAAFSVAQTPAKPAAPATTAPKPAATAAAPVPFWVKPPKGVPVVHGIVKQAFTLRYEDIKVGTGAVAEPNKLYKVQYTGWRAADGVKFDSSYDHRQPVMDKDGKPEMDADGKPKLGEAQPLQFPQGMRRLIPGFDQGFDGMKIGGKRRLFIPWQLAYGTQAMPDHGPDHPGIPAKSDLIFDIELVDVTDLPQQPQRPGMPPGRPMPPGAMRPGVPVKPGATPGAAPAPGSPAPGSPAPTPATAAPGTSAAPPAPSQPTTAPPPATAPGTGTPSAPPAPANPQPQTPPQ